MRITFLPETLEYFNELTTILYDKEYFGFKESALSYVDDLLDEIRDTLHIRITKTAPPYFSRYGEGMQYATFKKNKTTHWYFFFTIYKNEGDIVYLVRHISNNHVTAQLL